MSKLIQICDSKGLKIPEDPRPMEIIPADKAMEAIHVIRVCSANKTAAWFSPMNPFKDRKSVALRAMKRRREIAKIVISSQIGSLPGKPKHMSKDELLDGFLKKKGWK